MREGNFRTGSYDKTITKSPLARKGKQVALPTGEKDISESPTLKAKQSVGDLIFHMDDESSLSDHVIPVKPDPDYLRTPSGLAPSKRLSTASNENLQAQGSPNDRVDGSKWDANSDISKIPWRSVTPSKASVGLKDIMAEASPGPSTAAHFENPRHDIDNFRNLTPKLSQKERRKLKQQQIQEKLAEPEQPSSPWQVVADSKPKRLVFDDSGVSTTKPTNLATPPRPTPKPSLNLRQTIAGTPPPLPGLTPNTPPSKQSDHNFQYTSPAAATPNIIVPKRTPSTSTPSAQVSLASILHQQQTEKDVIQEAVTAKHDLHDIQVEQEFQAWWDMESKRVKDEAEAEAEARTKPRDGRGKRARGRGGNARSGGSSGRRRGNPSTRADLDLNPPSRRSAQAPASAPVPGMENNSNSQGGQPGRSGDDRRRQHGRGRGSGAGRGRGGGGRGGKTPRNAPARTQAS